MYKSMFAGDLVHSAGQFWKGKLSKENYGGQQILDLKKIVSYTNFISK